MRHDWAYLLAAAVLGLAFAALWWWIVKDQPIQPGDDPSTWIATSYYFIGVPAPSGVQPLAYPPAAFPFVGVAVWVGGGPLLGGRIFMAAMIALLGPVAYLFGRAILKMPSLALLGTGLLLAEPDFQQLYYFGGFPNVFAFLFMLLAVTYFVRWLRDRRSSHLLIFWVAAAVSILSHSLTAAVLAGTLAFVVVALILLRRLPRGFLVSRAGAVGAAILVVGVGAYYGLTGIIGVKHPSYLSSGTLGGTKSQLVPTVLRPFYLASILSGIEHQTVTLTANQSLGFMVFLSLVILLLFLLALWKRPDWISIGWLVLAATVLTVFAGTVGGYVANLPVDYRRFPYFLYLPIILALLLFLDGGLEYAMRRRAPRRLPAPVVGVRRAPVRSRPPLAWRRWVEPALLAFAVVAILVSVQFYTVPAATSYEAYYTEFGHDQDFLNAINGLQATGIPGNIVSTTPLIGHWPSTLTTRTTYDPAALGGNSYLAAQIIQGETAEITVANRIAVTNGQVAATLPGIEAGDFNAAPVIGAFNQNIYQPMLELPTGSFEAGSIKGPVTFFAPSGSAAPPISPIDNGSGFTMTFHGIGANLTETVVAVPNTSTVTVSLTATQVGPTPLSFFQVRVGGPANISNAITNGTAPGSFEWYTNTSSYGNFSAAATVTPASALTGIVPVNNSTGALALAIVHASAPNETSGASQLTVTISVTDPTASNLIQGLGPYILADQVWQSWSIRFVLLFNNSTASRPLTRTYYQTEYGATFVIGSGPYSIMLLPSPYGGPPWLTGKG